MSDHNHINPWASHTHSISLPIYTSSNVPSGTMYSIGDRLFTSASTLDTFTKQKEPEMTTLEKIRKEREEARERGRIEEMYTAYDEANLDGYESGMVLRFAWTPKDSERTYEYAALFVDSKWYVTGRESPNGLVTEDFVAWLIGKDVTVEDLIELVPS